MLPWGGVESGSESEARFGTRGELQANVIRENKNAARSTSLALTPEGDNLLTARNLISAPLVLGRATTSRHIASVCKKDLLPTLLRCYPYVRALLPHN